jgi:hypothetical protein
LQRRVESLSSGQRRPGPWGRAGLTPLSRNAAPLHASGNSALAAS